MAESSKFCGKCGKGIETVSEEHNKVLPIDKKSFAKPPKSVLKYALVPIGMIFVLVALWGVLGYMQGAGSTSSLFDVFNFLIPILLSITVLAIFIAPLYAVYSNSKNFDGTIKCGNCEYVGPGEPARKLGFNILAWLCVVIVPLVTIIYFLATHKYRCPKCKSTFLGMRTSDGVFVGQGSGSGSGVTILLLVIVGIAIIGIFSSVVLASLSTAREKSRDAMVISNLAQLQLGAELYYDQNNNTYSYAEDCQSGMFVSDDLSARITELASKNVKCFASGDNYSISASLEREDKSYCVDSSGSHKGFSAGMVGRVAKCVSSEGGPQSSTEWQEYTSLVGSFTALFPSSPTHETQNNKVDGTYITLVTEMYTSGDDDSAYFVAYTKYPTTLELDTPIITLEGVVNGMVETNPSNKLISTENTKIQNSPAVDFLISNSKEEIYLKGSVILRGRELYMVYYAYSTGLYSEADYSKFMNSFEMK
jgi:Tfp pilus assembly protein PilE